MGMRDSFKRIKLRTMLELLRSQLEIERSSFEPHWTDLSDFISPRSSRFFIDDTNEGNAINENIVDSTATMALRTTEAGMMTGITSPARPWFKTDLEDKSIKKTSSSIEWLAEVDLILRGIFQKSNLYTTLPMLYGSVALYSTGCMYIEEDLETTIRCRHFPIGSYFLGNDAKLRVRVFMREFQLTTRQIVEKFGQDPRNPGKIDWTNISTSVQSNYETDQMEKTHGIQHSIIPNPEYDPNKLDSRFKKYLSVYYERGGGQGGRSNQAGALSGGEEKILRQKGYDWFPILAARWSKQSEDVYGTDGPGMIALGDVKQLQHGEIQSAKATDKMIDPPLKGPTALRKSKVSMLPGHITYTDERDARGGLKSVYDVKFDITAMENKQVQVRQRINQAFFVDLFLMISSEKRRQQTATEVDAKQEEKLLVLGPVLGRLDDDVLDPLIDITFAIAERQGKIPPPPEEIAGKELKIEYISIVAQAQKIAGVNVIERSAGFIGQLAGINPNVLDKFDTDEAVDEYFELVGTPQNIARDADEVKRIRQAKADQAKADEERLRVQDSIEAAQGLSKASVEEDNVLARVINS